MSNTLLRGTVLSLPTTETGPVTVVGSTADVYVRNGYVVVGVGAA